MFRTALLIIFSILLSGVAHADIANCKQFIEINEANGWDMGPILRSIEKSTALQAHADRCIETMFNGPDNLMMAYDPLMNPPVLNHRKYNGVQEISWEEYKLQKLIISQDVEKRYRRALKAFPAQANYLLGRFYSDEDNCMLADTDRFCRTADAYNHLLIALNSEIALAAIKLSEIEFLQKRSGYKGRQNVKILTKNYGFILARCIKIARANSIPNEIEECISNYILKFLMPINNSISKIHDAAPVLKFDMEVLILSYKELLEKSVRSKSLSTTMTLGVFASNFATGKTPNGIKAINIALTDLILGDVDPLGIPLKMSTSSIKLFLESLNFYSDFEPKSIGGASSK